MEYRYFALFLFLLSVTVNLQAASQQLHIQGSNTIGSQLAPELVQAWLKEQGYHSVSVAKDGELTILHGEDTNGNSIEVEIEAKGSSTGFKGLLEGTADLGMSSRRIKQQEIEALAPLGEMTSMESEHVIALDGIAVIVHPNNPLTSLSKSAIRDIFTGKIADWNKVGGATGTINLYARDNESGTYEVFHNLILGKKTALSKNTKRFINNARLSAEVAADPQGIGFVGLPYILNSKALAISDGEVPAIAPSRFTIATEDYALSRRLYMYTPKQQPTNKLTTDFISFVHSTSAQKTIENTGFITQEVFLGPEQPGEQYPEEMTKLSANAKRLSVNMRFSERTVYLDNKAKRDADRVYSFLKQSKKLDNGLLLFGFAEVKPGGLRNMSFKRSERRADQVAKYLSKKGVRVISSRGYGGVAPVASNETLLGQEKNRRVELWLQ